MPSDLNKKQDHLAELLRFAILLLLPRSKLIALWKGRGNEVETLHVTSTASHQGFSNYLSPEFVNTLAHSAIIGKTTDLIK